MISVITCAVCNKPVEKTTVTRLPQLDEILYVVQCHGSMDRTRVPLALFRDGWFITGAKAFADEIAADTKQLNLPVLVNKQPVIVETAETVDPKHKLDYSGPEQWAPLLSCSL